MPPNKKAAPHGANQRAAYRNNKQLKAYHIYIAPQAKSGNPHRPAMTLPVIVLRAKHLHMDNGA